MALFDMKAYARRGAELRVAELNRELEAIYRAFPELRKGRAARGGASATPAAQEPPVAATPRRGARRKMTAAERKAVSQRMKKYWAERMKGKK